MELVGRQLLRCARELWKDIPQRLFHGDVERRKREKVITRSAFFLVSLYNSLGAEIVLRGSFVY